MRVSQVLLAAVCLSAYGLLSAGASAGIIPVVDYSDTYTVGAGGRPDGYYGGSSDYIAVEYAAPSLPVPLWTDWGAFSFNSPTTVYGGINPYPGSAGNPGSETGFIQTGGDNWSIEYGLRTDYIVQGDFNWPGVGVWGVGDSAAISSWATAGDRIPSATGGLTVHFRRDSVGFISLFNGITETATDLTTGIAGDDLNWHNFAVRFNQDDAELSVYVDEVLKGTLDLTSFAGGIYEDYSNVAVGLGVRPQTPTVISWCDNFQVGGEGAVPEPSTLVLLFAGCVVLIIRRYCN